MDKMEEQIYINLYEGEGKRNASSLIRGYLFQDLIAIDELLKKDTFCICSEYLEDIFVIANSEVRYIQAKYYPSSEPKMKEIMRDLYYQFLRFQLYNHKDNVIPMLCVHTSNKCATPNLNELQGYIGINENKTPLAEENFHQWMRNNIYPLNKKDAQTSFFNRFAWSGSMKAFLEKLEVNMDFQTLEEFRKYIVAQLLQLPFVNRTDIDNLLKGNILLGLAVQYIQNAYSEGKNTFDERICVRTEFLRYLEEHINTDNEEQIAAYLRSIVIETWERVESNNLGLAQEEINVLQCICDNTAKWMFTIGKTSEGQLQLLNTISKEPASSFEGFFARSVSERLKCIHEHKNSIMVFLRYLWKIMFNIVRRNEKLDLNNSQRTLLQPEMYFDENEKRYLKTVFLEDKAESSIILSGLENGTPWESLKNIVDRMKKVQPDKWYLNNCLRCFDNNATLHGKFDYELNVGKIKKGERPSVAELSGEMFRIES